MVPFFGRRREKEREKEMTKRTLSAGVIGLVTYTILYYSGTPAVIQTAAAALCCFCLYELACATDAIKNEALFTLSLLAVAIASFWKLPQEAVLSGVCLGISIPLFILMMIFQPKLRLNSPWAFLVLGVLVCGQLRSMIDVRSLPGGLHLLLICITECYATDVAAYLVGSRYGKWKLLPRVSPNKTVLGSLAGMGAAVCFCLLYGLGLFLFGGMQVHFGLLIVYAIIANVLAQFGDLSMSVIKRITGIKDYGNLIPGHGGLLDRFDSLIFVLPFTLLFFRVAGGFL